MRPSGSNGAGHARSPSPPYTIRLGDLLTVLAVHNDSEYGRRLLAKLDEQESRIETIRERLDELEAEAARQRDALRVSVGG